MMCTLAMMFHYSPYLSVLLTLVELLAVLCY